MLLVINIKDPCKKNYSGRSAKSNENNFICTCRFISPCRFISHCRFIRHCRFVSHCVFTLHCHTKWKCGATESNLALSLKSKFYTDCQAGISHNTQNFWDTSVSNRRNRFSLLYKSVVLIDYTLYNISTKHLLSKILL